MKRLNSSNYCSNWHVSWLCVFMTVEGRKVNGSETHLWANLLEPFQSSRFAFWFNEMLQCKILSWQSIYFGKFMSKFQWDNKMQQRLFIETQHLQVRFFQVCECQLAEFCFDGSALIGSISLPRLPHISSMSCFFEHLKPSDGKNFLACLFCSCSGSFLIWFCGRRKEKSEIFAWIALA